MAGSVVEWPVVIKSKPLDSETATMINKMAQACGLDLAVQYERHKMETGFRFVRNIFTVSRQWSLIHYIPLSD